MKNLWLTAIIWIFIICCSISAQNKQSLPLDWKLFNECGAQFSLPADYKEVKVRGIDSCLGKYRGASTVLMLDVLGYITPNASRKEEFSDERDVKYTKSTIDGRRAEIITFYDTEPNKDAIDFHYAAVLFIPQISKKDGGNFTIWTNSKSSEEREQAMKIFQTIRFPN